MCEWTETKWQWGINNDIVTYVQITFACSWENFDWKKKLLTNDNENPDLDVNLLKTYHMSINVWMWILLPELFMKTEIIDCKVTSSSNMKNMEFSFAVTAVRYQN